MISVRRHTRNVVGKHPEQGPPKATLGHVKPGDDIDYRPVRFAFEAENDSYPVAEVLHQRNVAGEVHRPAQIHDFRSPHYARQIQLIHGSRLPRFPLRNRPTYTPTHAQRESAFLARLTYPVTVPCSEAA